VRTTFAALDGRPLQVIHPPLALPLPELDLSALPEPARDARLFVHASEGARRPFDLGRGPLLRALLVRLAESSHVLLLTLHHLVADS
jgi:hypothetical protein